MKRPHLEFPDLFTYIVYKAKHALGLDSRRFRRREGPHNAKRNSICGVGVMPYSPLAIANEFIALAQTEGRGLEHMKLQKLTHFAHGYGLARDIKVSNENPQVWKFGPVFDSLYHELKYHGSDPISEPEGENYFGPVPRIDGEDAEAVRGVINEVWGKYRNFTGFQLSDKTHREGTPWYQLVQQRQGRIPNGLTIPDELIRDHYLGILDMAG